MTGVGFGPRGCPRGRDDAHRRPARHRTPGHPGADGRRAGCRTRHRRGGSRRAGLAAVRDALARAAGRCPAAHRGAHDAAGQPQLLLPRDADARRSARTTLARCAGALLPRSGTRTGYQCATGRATTHRCRSRRAIGTVPAASAEFPLRPAGARSAAADQGLGRARAGVCDHGRGRPLAGRAWRGHRDRTGHRGRRPSRAFPLR